MNKDQQRQQKFKDFLEWFKKNIKGDEKKEDKLFLNELLKAFGNPDLLSAGAKTEVTLKKKSGSTGFIDFLWGDRVLIELKKRNTPLAKHYQQATDYWMMTTPKPKYMVLCNFDEFWIYDFNIQMNDPVHKLQIKNLVNEYTALSFLFPIPEEPFFNNNYVEVTEEAAKIIGKMYYSLQQRKIDPFDAQRFVLQLVVALFSEDTGLIPKDIIRKILESATRAPSTQSDLMDLFTAMATQQQSKKPKKYSNIPYFNGGIFDTVKSFELNYNEIHQLAEAAKQDWSKVRPSIFGSIFETSIDQKDRHDRGIHYTSELDIQKIVGPTIVRPFREKIERASNNKQELIKILEEVRNFKVLDPACGSGNFLYIAFRELRRLEIELLELTETNFNPKKIKSSLISPKNFYGIDTNKFGIELAKLALCIGRKISADEFDVNDKVLPFENLDDNFLEQDALFAEWPKAQAIIGNPPFLGRGKTKSLNDNNPDYVKKLHNLYPLDTFPRSADYCCYWFRKAHDSKAKTIGLVGSNSISQGNSRKASLDYIVENGGIITNAVSTQSWQGDAKVHVSIVNWSRSGSNPIILDGKEVSFINSSLKNEIDVTKAEKLAKNLNICFQGVVPQPLERYLVEEKTAQKWITKNIKNKLVVKRLLSADDLTDKHDFKSNRFLIDFNEFNIELASTFDEPFKYVKLNKENKVGKNNSEHKKWWQLWRSRPAMKSALENAKNYIAMPGHSKWFVPVIVPCDYLAYVNSSFVIATDDYYLLGLLTSKLHRDWVKAQSSTLKGDTRYTNTTCFETFPFLWEAPKKLKDPIRKIMKQLDDYRMKTMKSKKYGITKLYNDFFNEPSSELYKLHRKLDMAVAKVYGWKYDPNKNYNENLYKLNLMLHKADLEAAKKDKSSEKMVMISSKKQRPKYPLSKTTRRKIKMSNNSKELKNALK